MNVTPRARSVSFGRLINHNGKPGRFARSCAALACLGSLLVLACGPAAGDQRSITATRIASGLTEPLYVTHVPGDPDRIFVVERPGTIRIIDISGDPAVVIGKAFLDIHLQVVTEAGEQGLLGLAFHPDFATNGYFYVNYTGSEDATRVSRFEVPPESPNVADEASEFVLLTLAQPQPNHNGGWIEFGLDGYLYIATGDGGNSNDSGQGHTLETGNAQDITDNLLGKILRIDVDGSNAPSGTYGIPPDNPFVGSEGDDEIWVYGLRNPWRNAFDPLTGDLYIADVGQADWEEIDFQPGDSPGGENWGWRCREGAHNFDFSGDCLTATLLDPIYEYHHIGTTSRCSIIGGEVYRGCAIPWLRGAYFFADLCSNQVWSFRYVGAVTEFQERTAELASRGAVIRSVTSFGRDAEGELYLCGQTGGIFKIIPTVEPAECYVAVPAVSQWGLVLITAGLLTAATLLIRHRKTPSQSSEQPAA